MVRQMTPQEIEDEARTWLNTPFVDGAHLKGVGTDCGGFMFELFKPCIDAPPAYPRYPSDWPFHRENEIYLDFMAPWVEPIDSPEQADITMWQFGRNYSHGSLFTKRGTYIHAFGYSGHGQVQENPPSFFKNRGGIERKCKHFRFTNLKRD